MTDNNTQTATPSSSYIDEISLNIDQNASYDADLAQETSKYDIDNDVGINNYLAFEMNTMEKMIEDLDYRLTEDSYSSSIDRENDEDEFYDLTSLIHSVRNTPRNSQKLDLLAKYNTN